MISIRFSHRFEHLGFDIDLELPSKGVTALFGRSGAGKSTIANVLSGLMKPDSGRVELNGHCVFDNDKGVDLPVWQRRFGVVFQEHRLFPHLTVLQNLQFSRASKGGDKLDEIVALLGLESLLKHKPHQLSGGEKQRVAIGRCLLSEPELIIMDEPLSALDAPRRSELLSYLRRLHQQVSIPIIYITHSLTEIVQLADHMVVIEQGLVVAQGSPTEVMASKALQEWGGASHYSSLLHGSVSAQANEYGYSQLKLSDDCHLWVSLDNEERHDKARVRIDASNVSISLVEPEASSIRNRLPATIVSLEPLSNATLMKLSVADQTLWAEISQWAAAELELAKGQVVFAQIKALSLEKADVAEELDV